MIIQLTSRAESCDIDTKDILYYIIDDMKTINALRARSRLGTLLDEVSQKGEHYVIERLSRPLVAVVPFSEYQTKIQDKEAEIKRKREEAVKEIFEFRKKYGRKLAKGKDSAAIIRKMRDERYGQKK